MSAVPECGGLGPSEEKEREEGEEKADDDAVEHRPPARVALGGPATGASAATAEGVNPLFLQRTCVLLVYSGGFKKQNRGFMERVVSNMVGVVGGTGGRTFFFCWEFRCGDIVGGRARMKLPSEVEDVIFGETCRRQAIKAAQGLDLRLLEVYGYGYGTVVCGVVVERFVIGERQISWQKPETEQETDTWG